MKKSEKREGKTSALRCRTEKFLQQCIQIGVLQLVITWQQLDPATDIENRKETNMQEMINFTHPIELSNEELDLVAAGTGGGGGHGGHRCGCDGGDETNQFGLVNLNNVNVGVNILGIQAQSAG
jgi:hypothetical protein